MKKFKLFALGVAILGSFTLAFADASLDPGSGTESPLCGTYCTPSEDFNCQIRQKMSETTCYFKKVKSQYGGVN